MDFATLGRAPMRLSLGTKRITSTDLQIAEATEELLAEEIPEPEGVAQDFVRVPDRRIGHLA